MVDPQFASTAEHLMAAKMFSLASCVMIFYEVLITMDEEVERIWKRKFTPVTFLWFLNRYLSPLGYIVIIVSFHDPWSIPVCNRYVLFPEALKIVTSFTIGVIFILRLYAIYQRSTAMVIAGTMLLAAELAVKIWAFTDGTSLTLPPGLVGCILVGRHDARFVCTWIAELVFDSVVFFATLIRVISHHRVLKRTTHLTLIDVIMRDGVVYFAVIFIANLVTVLMFLLAPPDIKAVNASFSTLITSLMVSRLMLNLRGVGLAQPGNDGFQNDPIIYSGTEPSTNTEFDSDVMKKLFALRRALAQASRA
ncbi:hypothetical protein AMATHDRAFT_81343 [Amanita thiersii Skay4041]|uniref:DUF6533 domain-containing protein n=1 Tax=Amanita thiersii Skay4041 TaxID=703135 RepID=A0A2A9NH17_9AGAR|nr:hypothetical protein AMATHDRAFT_81343 [Amanita thiersii Skay4041]